MNEASARSGGPEVAPGLFHCVGKPVAEIASDTIVAVTYVRDEAWRLPFWLAYHRWLGVEHFIMIDNASVDQTCDLLAEQPDVTLLSAPGCFEWFNWSNDIIRLCPPAGWSLAIDADELLVAPPWRQGGLRHTIRALQAEGAEAAFALMVDCHAESLLPSAPEVPAVPWQRAPWFDRGPYVRWLPWLNSPLHLHSGARERIAWARWRYWRYVPPPLRTLTRWIGHRRGLVDPPYIVKLPLHRSRARGRTIHTAGSRQRATSCFGLLHYKFDIDLPQKVQSALAERQHWNSSAEYTVYARLLEQGSHDLRTRESVRFTGLSSLVEAQICRFDPAFLDRVSRDGPIETALCQVESEVMRFGDRHLSPSVSRAAFA